MSFNSSQNILGLTALIVSLVALVTTVLQVLQQYFSSAEGYRRCAESVIGLWSKGTHRKLRAHEFRIEVVFETPVIFLAPPDNKRGPIPGRNIHYLDGTELSYKNTRVLGPTAQKQADEQAIARVHTADDEQASWVTLLSTLQREEGDSRKWDDEIRNKTHTGVRIRPPEYRLAVGLQSKTRSWDFMPAAVTKPYATLAMCHLIEMMAMLGIYWKVFDQIQWNLRAEGNGFILTSTVVDGLGVMVVFAITGKSRFLENRVIPTKDIKELCFGTVPNIFDNPEYLDREKDAQSLDLVFGTSEEVSTTLESLGFSFEIIGILGKVFRIRGSSFRMIPNPTSDHWLKNNGPKALWKITRLMKVFQDKLRELSFTEDLGPGHPITAISDQWKIIQGHNCTDEANLSIELREAIHNALDERTEYLLSLRQSSVLSVLVTHLTKVMEILDDPNSPLNCIVLANKEEALLSYYFYQVRPAVIGNLDSAGKLLSKDKKEQRSNIWVTLIFRILCWLLLHDFDKADVKVVPSDLKGSRMPVYIG